MARDVLYLYVVGPNRTNARKENPMLTLTLFFVAGILLGVVGLRLLRRWETHSDKRPTIFRHHS